MNYKTIKMRVTKRSGIIEEVMFDKISERIRKLVEMPPKLKIDIGKLTQIVIQSLVDLITTSQIDKITANVCCDLLMYGNYDYEILARRIELSNLYKNTIPKFSDFMKFMSSQEKNLIADWVGNYIDLYGAQLDEMIDETRDNQFSYLGISTMLNSYLLLDSNKKVVERPQYLFMRTSIELWREDLESVKECYDLISQFYMTQATPTLFNSCLKKNQLSSCMLLTNQEDSIPGIYQTLADASILGAESAGIGVDVTNIRGKGTLISSSNRPSRGVIPFLKLYDSTASDIIDQGGKRPMSIAVYMQPWHADFIEFVKLRSNDDNGQFRFRELFYAVWNNNLLNYRAEKNMIWSFFCPTKAPNLLTTYGKDFEREYIAYENANLYEMQIPAQEVYKIIAKLMIETGQPYHLNKDSCNFKSNLKNISQINCSNLCTEILIPSGTIDGKNNIGVCTLASINLKKFVSPCKFDVNGNILVNGSFDFNKLRQVSRNAVKNLNKCIDRQRYSLKACRRSSFNYRPIGIGIQGLAEVFMLMGFEYESPEARIMNQHISEEIYYGALQESMELSIKYGPYKGFEGSPAHQGKLQPHLWEEYNQINNINWPMVYKYNWDSIAREVQAKGLYNSLLVAYMPTASTSRLFNTIPSFDPNIANIYTKKTIASEFIIVNYNLVKTLEDIGIWSQDIQKKIIIADGSVQNVLEIPQKIRAIYKTAYEMSMKNIMNMAADRGFFICQSQSLNLYFGDITMPKITSAINYGMKIGLKTIAYYTRSRSATEAVKVTLLTPDSLTQKKAQPSECNRNDKTCESCMS